MARDVVYVQPDLGIEALEELLLASELPGAPVVGADRRLVGYVTMADIVREVRKLGRTGRQTRTVAQLMTPIAFDLRDSASLGTAIRLMIEHRVRRIPVVSDDGVLVGIVTSGDVLRCLTRRTPDADESSISDAERVVSLGFIAGGLAHQVNNVLTPMRLALGRLTSFELSRRPFSEEHTHRIELLQDLREGLDRVQRVVRELTVFSHVNDAPVDSLDVIEVLDAALAVVAHEIRHRAKLVREYAPAPRVRARAADLRQVFLSLLINAVQAIPEGEAHLNEIVVKTWTDARGLANIEIRDTGSGIAAEVLPQIFKPFFTTHPGRALGFGLVVARELVTELGGKIEVDSVVGQGTAIRIALPASPISEQAFPVAEADDRPAARSCPRRILIIDDDRPVAAAIALELGNDEVVVAESGVEALSILRRDKRFDVILCDVMMPEISGKDVYEALQLTEPALLARLVLMTGGAFTRSAGDFLAGVDVPILEKPFEAYQLRAIIDGLGRRETSPSELVASVATATDSGASGSKNEG